MVVNCQQSSIMEKQITILIAEDNAFMRESLRSVISVIETARLIGEAENGEEAIKLAKEYSPEIILMDINMSPVNGFEATRKIIKDNPGVKIIGLSDNIKIFPIKNLLKLGAISKDAYLWGRSSKGYCRVAQTFILCKTLTAGYYKKKGYTSFYDLYYGRTEKQIKLF